MSGKITVYAQYPERKDYQALLEYFGTGSNKRIPSPVKFERYMNSGAELVERVEERTNSRNYTKFSYKDSGCKESCCLLSEKTGSSLKRRESISKEQ